MILITGGAGYIGSHAAVELLESGYDIVIVDALDNSNMEAIFRIKELTGKDFPFYQINLLDYRMLSEVFKKHDIDAVMHFAGLKAVGESGKEPLKYYRNNIAGTLYLCEMMKKFNVKKLIFSSSATVYGNPDSLPIDETHPLSPSNPYGRTKMMVEEILKDLAASDSTWKIAVLRYFNPIGAHVSGRLGEDPTGVPNNLMPYITQVAIGKREMLQVFGGDYDTHDGTGVRDYIHVTDLVKGHVKALQFLEAFKGIEVFNLGTGRGYSVLDIISTFSLVTNKDIPYQFAPRREGDVASYYADSTKARTVLGWETRLGLLDMCRDSWNWQIKNPSGYQMPIHMMAAVYSKETSNIE